MLTGEVRAGESWYAGAARLLGEHGRTSDVPLPRDLSGPEKRFTCSPDHRNLASRRVLAKVGFVERHRFDERDTDGALSTVVAHTFDIARVMG